MIFIVIMIVIDWKETDFGIKSLNKWWLAVNQITANSIGLA